MALKVTDYPVWAADIQDQPGGLAKVLETLAEAGANLECVIARKRPEKKGSGVVFVTPLEGKKAVTAAEGLGFKKTGQTATLKIEGEDRPGLGAEISRAVGDAGISMRGLSAAVVGDQFVAYLGFDSHADAEAAAEKLRSSDL